MKVWTIWIATYWRPGYLNHCPRPPRTLEIDASNLRTNDPPSGGRSRAEEGAPLRNMKRRESFERRANWADSTSGLLISARARLSAFD